MNEDFNSHRLQHFLKSQLKKYPAWGSKLRHLLNCGTVGDIRKGVTILSNGVESRIFGVRMCNHSWCCPACTARKMAKYRKRIGAGIDALAKQNLVPIMITFTVFHTKMQSCRQTFKLLRETWTKFNRCASWKRERKTPRVKVQINSQKVIAGGECYNSAGAWHNFLHLYEIKHYVKTLEATYGKHGWHPHIHLLCFVPKHKLNEIAKWQDKLCEQWLKLEDKAAKKIFTAKKYEVRKFLQSKKDRPDADHKGLFMSINDDGSLKVFKSGDYICGWGGDNELTGSHLKTARKDNMTPFQMLETAYNLQITSPTKSKELLFRFFQFADTVLKDRIARIAFSRTGFNAIIKNQLNSQEYKEVYKKKCQQLNIKPYKTICWIPGSTWLELQYIDNNFVPLKCLILRFATYDNAYELICELFQVNNLSPPLRENPFDKNGWAEWINEKIYATAA